MKPIFKLSFLFVCFCLLATSFVKAQTEDELVTAINSKLIPLNTLTPDSDYSDLETLKTILKDKQILGLGEATHGTHEFFVFKHRMLEFLVKKMGYRTFGIEASFAGTQIMNDYVLNGKGNVYRALGGLGIGVWMTQEFVDMANWVKDYNATQPVENKVSFYGFDMQDAFTPPIYIKECLKESNQFTPELDSGFSALKRALNKPMNSMTGKEKANMKATIAILKNIKYAEQDTSKVKLYNHIARVLEQCYEYIDAVSTLFPARQDELRDKFMAENCDWIYNYTGKNKMVLWAHNQHIGKSMGKIRITRLGSYLKNTYQDKYYAFGFSFYDGSLRAFNFKNIKYESFELPLAIPNSVDHIFSKAEYPDFILDMKSALTDANLNKLLSIPVYTRSLGADYAANQSDIHNYLKFILPDTFDGIIFIRHTTPSTGVKPKKI